MRYFTNFNTKRTPPFLESSHEGMHDVVIFSVLMDNGLERQATLNPGATN